MSGLFGLLVLAALVAGGYYLYKRNQNDSGGGGGGGSVVYPPTWTSVWGDPAVKWDTAGDDQGFTFVDGPYGVHGFVNGGFAPKVGQTMKLAFAISGVDADHHLQNIEAADSLPVKTTLFLWQKGDTLSPANKDDDMVNYRMFGARLAVADNGAYEVSAVLEAENFTGVYGAHATPERFQQLLDNLQAVGFTWGANYFAAHGVRAFGGGVRFTLKEFSIS